jgi:PKD repeat protein
MQKKYWYFNGKTVRKGFTMNEKPYVTKSSLTKRMFATFLAVMLACATMVVAPAAAFGDDGTFESGAFICQKVEVNDVEGVAIVGLVEGYKTSVTPGLDNKNKELRNVFKDTDKGGELTVPTQLVIDEKATPVFYVALDEGDFNKLKLDECVYLLELTCTNGIEFKEISLNNRVGVQAFNVSGCESLTSVNLDNNLAGLETVNVSGCTNLKELKFNDNNALGGLTSIDCSGCESLAKLDLSKNSVNLLELDCSGCVLLDTKNFKNLDKQEALEKLDCSGCNLTELDVTKNAALIELNCSGNDIKSLDLSNNRELAKLDASGNENLTELIISLENNPNLLDVNVDGTDLDEDALADLQDALDAIEAFNAAAITSFVINGVAGVIDDEAGTIAVELPFGTAVTALEPVIEVAPNGVVDLTGAQDFTNPVDYTVAAENGETTKTYTVTVTIAPAPAPEVGPVVPPVVAPANVKPAISGVAKATVNVGYKQFSKTFKVAGTPKATLSLKVPAKAKGKISINQNGKLTVKKGLKKGKYPVTITAKNAAGKADKKVTIVVNAKGSALIAGPDEKALKVGYKKTSINCKVTGANAKVSIKVPAKAKGKITINKKGKVTVKKGLAAGTYNITLKAANSKGKMDRVLTIVVK